MTTVGVDEEVLERMWRNRSPAYITDGNVKWSICFGKQSDVSLEGKTELPCDPASPVSVPQRSENITHTATCT